MADTALLYLFFGWIAEQGGVPEEDLGLDNKKVIAETGQDCPVTGLWEVTDRPGARSFFSAGDIVPPCEGDTVIWQLVQPGEKKQAPEE